MGSVALLVVYPAFCQLVLKKRKMIGSSTSQNISVNVINTGSHKSTSSVSKSVPLTSIKNNNITLNNEKPGKEKQYCNLLNEKNAIGNKADDIDLEHASDEEDGTEKCSKKSWSTLYIQLLSWKWFSVRFT